MRQVTHSVSDHSDHESLLMVLFSLIGNRVMSLIFVSTFPSISLRSMCSLSLRSMCSLSLRSMCDESRSEDGLKCEGKNNGDNDYVHKHTLSQSGWSLMERGECMDNLAAKMAGKVSLHVLRKGNVH